MAAHRSAKHRFEHLLLKAGDDQVTLEHVHDGRVTFQNVWAAFSVALELRHVSLRITDASEPFGTLYHGTSSRLGFQRRGLFLKDIVKELFRRVRSVDFPS